MKIEKLTDNKVRIIINLDELASKNINLKNISSNNVDMHSFFKSMLDEAEKQVGFHVKDCRLLIEAFSSSDGYIVFTLTKYKNDISVSTTKKLSFKRKALKNSYKNAIYKFDNFEEFCNFCTYCNNSKLGDLNAFCKNISLYTYKGNYYLVFLSINLDCEYTNSFYASISEFGSLCSSSIILKNKLNEYGKPVFKTKAVQRGIKYFCSGAKI